MKDKRKNLLICIIIALTLILGISLVIFFCNKKDNRMPPVNTPAVSTDKKIDITEATSFKTSEATKNSIINVTDEISDNTINNATAVVTPGSVTEEIKKTAGITLAPTVQPTAESNYDNNSNTQILLKDSGTVVKNNNGGVRVADNGYVYITKAGEYDISGSITNKSLIVEMSDGDKATLNLKGVSITSSIAAPISILSGDKVEISATSGTTNNITDNRTVSNNDASGGAIDSSVDLEIKGKGVLNVTAEYNNGIDTKDDLEIKNLTLKVKAPNNALKGNDTVTVESGNITAISTQGDGIKTSNSDVSAAGNRRGIVSIIGGTVNIYAACDGIDASYDAIITGGTVNIYTESFSSYSEEVTAASSSTLYLKFSSRTRPGSSSFSHMSYKYSVKFTLADGSSVWKNASAASNSNPGSSSAYYKVDLPANAKYLQVFVYSSSMTQGQGTTYSFATDTKAVNASNDTLSYSSSNSTSKTISFSWTNYTTQGGMGGGMNEGNPDAAEYSCKGIKADNSVAVSNGIINIKSHDDAIHSNGDVLLEGGTVNIYCNDDGIHGDTTVNISAGKINIQKSYEGVEAPVINIKGGTTYITSSDDAMNANASNASLNISGGLVYFNAGGDGIDSNSAVEMSGGIVLAQGPSNGGNGVIDYDRSFSFKGGLLLAIGANGMNQKPTATSGNTVITKNISTNTSSYVTLTVDGKVTAVLKITKSSQSYCVAAFNNTEYGNSGSVSVSSSVNVNLTDGLYYVK